MNKTPIGALRGFAALTLCFVLGVASAQENALPDADPPDLAARLSYLDGVVSMQPAGEEDWADAIVNRPLTTGDKLWTDSGARAEIQVGRAAVRLDGSTGFSFLNVNDDIIQMRITAGVINLSVRELAGNEQIEIDTPNLALSLLRPGTYRVEVDDEGDTSVVKVSEGLAEATGDGQSVLVHAQQVITVRGGEQFAALFGTLGAPDAFDSWSLERERRDDRAETSQTAQYVAPDVTGYEDLEENGTWNSEPEYGYVWTPRVAVGWAPYQFGRWVWVSPWGWSWIDDSRWGYAPFHYGRWAHVRNRWCWVPGPRHVRAVYAPALVGWGGSHGGNVSWFPLGPREVYVPSRHFSHRYLERVNGSNTMVSRELITRAYENRLNDATYRNRAVPGGVTTVTRQAFASAGRTGTHRVRLSEQERASGVASAIAPRIEPLRESRLGAPRTNVRVPPQNIANRQVIVRRDPPPAVAHFARRPAASTEVAQTPERVARPPIRGQVNNPSRGANISESVIRSNRDDRPPRAERPTTESAPPAQTSVYDRRALSERVRADRERQVREGQEQRETLQQREAQQQREALQQREASQQREEQSQRWQRQEAEARQQREQSQASRDLQNQLREQVRRQQENQRQAAPRQIEQRERNTERPQVERPQVERPQAERRQVERPPQPERPQAERPQRNESRAPAESRSQPRDRDDGNSRSRRN